MKSFTVRPIWRVDSYLPSTASPPRSQSIDQQPTRTSREIVSLTSLRGYLAIWVVIGHFWQEILALLPGLDFLSPWAEHGHSAVPGFFVLSGWVLSHNYRQSFVRGDVTWLRFLGLRLARVYPVHLAMIVALGALVVGAAIAGRPAGGSYGLSALITQLLLVQAWVPGMAMTWNYPAWSVSSEWFAYLLFPLAAKAEFLFASRRRSFATAVVATVGTVCVIVFWKPLPLKELALVVPCFLAGMSIQTLVAKEDRFGDSGPRVAAILVGGMLASCFVPNFIMREFLLASIPAVIIYLLASRGSASAGPAWEARPVRVLGEMSYSLYMVHSLVEKVLTQFFPPQRYVDAGWEIRLGLVALWVLATGIATWGCYALVERPARRLMRRMLA